MQLQSAVTSMASGLYRGLALPLRSDAMGPRERLQVRVHSRAGRAFVGPTLVHGTLSSPRYFTTITLTRLNWHTNYFTMDFPLPGKTTRNLTVSFERYACLKAGSLLARPCRLM